VIGVSLTETVLSGAVLLVAAAAAFVLGNLSTRSARWRRILGAVGLAYLALAASAVAALVVAPDTRSAPTLLGPLAALVVAAVAARSGVRHGAARRGRPGKHESRLR
jgi:multisubunit Na+/H+ antiporter MnhE subunit